MLVLQIKTTAYNASILFWPWLLWFLGAFLLGIALGWLLKLIKEQRDTTNTEDFSAKIKGLKHDLATCNKEKTILAANAAVIKASLAAATTPKKPTKIDDSIKDDFTKIEGIGPKIKSLLNTDGIWSFTQLSKIKVSRLQNILDNAGSRYKVHKPESWPHQSKLAAQGKWKELQEWNEKEKNED